jgi:hypothetical protein
MLTAFAPPQIGATTAWSLRPVCLPNARWSGGVSRIGVMGYWSTLHHSIFFGRFSHELPIHRPAGAAYR